MTHLPYRTVFCAFVTLIPISIQAQIVTGWDDSLDNKVVTSIEDTTGAAKGVLLNWNNILGEFGELVDVAEQELNEKISKEDTYSKTVKTIEFQGNKYEIPTWIDENGSDLYYLTDEGIELYLALQPPVYYESLDKDIKRWILYYMKKKDYTQSIFRKYKKYKPLFDYNLNRYHIPTELSLLTIIESGCDPRAVSPVGAKGVWQMMPETAKQYQLRVNETFDDRIDVAKATKAASKYLVDAFIKTHNWTLAVASYNCGMGRTGGLIKKYRQHNWQPIKKYFPKETRQYVPALIAVYYIWTYQDELGMSV